ncbi:MAG: S49 family peptidase [Terriglobales bacterium]
MKYSRILNAFFSSNWAILPEKYEAIKALLELRAANGHVSDEEIKAIVAASKRPSPKTPGNVVVIPVCGVICYRSSLMSDYSGGTSVQGLTKQFRAALADDTVKAIVFDIDSPGGDVDGIQELGDEIFAARGQKKMVAVANTTAASAAYWLASAADEVVVSPSGMVGSIGVFTTHNDRSEMDKMIGLKVTYISAGKYKTEANPDEPLSAEAQAAIQSFVDSFYGTFVADVARNRDVPATDVKNGFGQARCVVAKDALKLGMVDRIATFDQTLARFGVSGQVKQMSAEVVDSAIQAASQPAAELECECECPACMDDDCTQCSNPDCNYAGCVGCPQQADDENAAAAPVEVAATPNKHRMKMRGLRMQNERLRKSS